MLAFGAAKVLRVRLRRLCSGGCCASRWSELLRARTIQSKRAGDCAARRGSAGDARRSRRRLRSAQEVARHNVTAASLACAIVVSDTCTR